MLRRGVFLWVWCLIGAFLAFGQGGTLPTPVNLTAQVSTMPSYGVAMMWSAPDGPWFYRVYRSTSDSLHFAPIGYAVSKKYLDRTIAPLETYYYTVRAVDTLLQEGPRSSAVSVTTGQIPQQIRGFISGVVTSDVSGDSLDGVLVRFFHVDTVTHIAFSTVTDSLGLYQALLDTGRYLVNAVSLPLGGSAVIYEPEWYQNAKTASEATSVNVSENATATVNFGLATAIPPAPAHIRGFVKDTWGAPLSGASVAVFRTIQELHRFAARYGIPPGYGPEAEELPGLGYVKGVVWTGVSDALGQYDAQVRKERSYIAVAWKSGYIPEYYSETADPTLARIIMLTGDTSGVDFTLSPVGGASSTVSGSVKGEDGDAVVSRVILFPRPNGTATPQPAAVSTDSKGEYEISGVPTGTYYVQAVPYSGYSAAYYSSGEPGVDSWQSADSVVVAGNVSNVNIVVDPVASLGTVTLSGNVELGDGSPVQGASVTARTPSGTVVAYGMTDGNGAYVLEAVPQGTVVVDADRIGYSQDGESVVTPSGTYEKGNVDLILGTIVSVPEGETIPMRPELHQNYPNPFNPQTRLVYTVTARGLVVLKVFDVLGREVGTLVNQEQNPGRYSVLFDAMNLAAGVYYYQLRVVGSAVGAGEGFVQTRMMLLLR